MRKTLLIFTIGIILISCKEKSKNEKVQKSEFTNNKELLQNISSKIDSLYIVDQKIQVDLNQASRNGENDKMKELFLQEKEIFEKCFNILNKGETLMIFPEGSHDKKRTIRPLSKGFTRIVFGALEKYKDLEIKVIPVGITYQHPSDFPTKVTVNYGKPIGTREIFENNATAKSINILKTKVSQQLQTLSVHITDDENFETTLQRLTDSQVDFTKVDEVNNMIQSDTIPGVKKGKTNFLKPLFYLIILNSIIPFLIWKKASKKIDEIEFIDTFRFVFNFVSFPIFYGLQTWILSYFFGGNIAGIYILSSVLLIIIYSKLSITNTETEIHHELS